MRNQNENAPVRTIYFFEFNNSIMNFIPLFSKGCITSSGEKKFDVYTSI